MIKTMDDYKTNARILLISDSPSIINLLTIMLKQNGYNVISASDVESALRSASDNPPDLVLLKLNMSETGGCEACKILKDNGIFENVPVIFICADENTIDKDWIFSSGGIDYLTRPFNAGEVLSRIETHLKVHVLERHYDKLKKENINLEKKVLEQQRQMEETTLDLKEFNILIEREINAYNKNEEDLKKARIEAERAASTDYLTGLLNRRAFSERFNMELSRIKRTKQSIGLIIVDIDHFKRINDAYSHQIGDAVLQRFSKCLTAVSRPYDFISRHGGEEFLVCLPDTDINETRNVADRMRSETEKMDICISGSKEVIKITASFGLVACESDSDEILDSLIHKADQAMYRAKSEGRNRVCCAE